MTYHSLDFIEESVLDILKNGVGLTLAEIKQELKIIIGERRILKNLKKQGFVRKRKGKFFLVKKP